MAECWNVNPEIHPEDFIFKFLYDNPSFRSKEEAIEYYFNDGAKSAQQLGTILTDICKYNDNNIDLLEFASGFGCVTRHIKKTIPFCNSTACDIHEKAIGFIENKLGAKAVLSKSDPRQFRLKQKYDVVFALSFFSHMPKRTFTLWLNSLAGCLKPGGHLIFTTHGFLSLKYFGEIEFDDEGFYFNADSEQKDLDVTEYGMTVTKPKFVIDRILGDAALSLKFFQEGYWWGHQDLYVARLDDALPNLGILGSLKSLFSSKS